MFGLPGGTEWILLALLVLLLFGSARLPRLARSMREAKDEFKKEREKEKESPVAEAHTENPEPSGQETPQEKA
jgi:sec-independent protein translocase protein TatA